jgi:hypothetical protein
MVMEIDKSTKSLSTGSVVLFTNNKKVADEINNDKIKANDYAQDSSLIITKIKKIIDKSTVIIAIE